MFEKRVRCSLDESFATVVYLRTGEVVTPRFYLARKKQNSGTQEEKSTLWNSYAGKWQQGDRSIYATARRALFEKSGGVSAPPLADLTLGARIEIFLPGNVSNLRNVEVFFFTTYKYSKYPNESESMGVPELFTSYEAPYKEMMPADEIILPVLMSNKRIRGKIYFSENDEGKHVVSRKELFTSSFPHQ